MSVHYESASETKDLEVFGSHGWPAKTSTSCSMPNPMVGINFGYSS